MKTSLILIMSFFSTLAFGDQRLDFSQLDNYWSTLDEMYSQEEIDHKFNLPLFVPIGWSEEGKFSYFEEVLMPARGDKIITFYIINSVTDEILVNQTYDGLKNNRENIRNYIMNDGWPDIQTHLDEFKIQLNRGGDFYQLPYTFENLNYSAVETTVKVPEADYDDAMEVIDKLSISIIRSDGKEKLSLMKILIIFTSMFLCWVC